MAGRIFVLLIFAAGLTAQAWVQALLPGKATSIETAEVKPANRGPRLLVLWMFAPKMEYRLVDSPCTERVYGDSYLGPARLSLVDVSQ